MNALIMVFAVRLLGVPGLRHLGSPYDEYCFLTAFFQLHLDVAKALAVSFSKVQRSSDIVLQMKNYNAKEVFVRRFGNMGSC